MTKARLGHGFEDALGMVGPGRALDAVDAPDRLVAGDNVNDPKQIDPYPGIGIPTLNDLDGPKVLAEKGEGTLGRAIACHTP